MYTRYVREWALSSAQAQQFGVEVRRQLVASLCGQCVSSRGQSAVSVPMLSKLGAEKSAVQLAETRKSSAYKWLPEKSEGAGEQRANGCVKVGGWRARSCTTRGRSCPAYDQRHTNTVSMPWRGSAWGKWGKWSVPWLQTRHPYDYCLSFKRPATACLQRSS